MPRGETVTNDLSTSCRWGNGAAIENLGEKGCFKDGSKEKKSKTALLCHGVNLSNTRIGGRQWEEKERCLESGKSTA